MVPAAGRWEDFASFMVPRKPGGGGCVCMAYRNSSLDMPERVAHLRGLCDSEPGPGVLAYVDGQVAGWCSAAPKPSPDQAVLTPGNRDHPGTKRASPFGARFAR